MLWYNFNRNTRIVMWFSQSGSSHSSFRRYKKLQKFKWHHPCTKLFTGTLISAFEKTVLCSSEPKLMLEWRHHILANHMHDHSCQLLLVAHGQIRHNLRLKEGFQKSNMPIPNLVMTMCTTTPYRLQHCNSKINHVMLPQALHYQAI